MNSTEPLSPPYARACWCGDPRQFAYSKEYNVCRSCGTLISRAATSPESFAVVDDANELYSRDYWLNRQSQKYGLPPIQQRARLDLPERCVHWLRLLLTLKLPPARTLEIGCAHGGFVALMNWAGFVATGTEMSPWVVDYARQIFGIDVRAGPLEGQSDLIEASFDAIILNDVLEHLPDPIQTMNTAKRLLKPDGVIVIQTPEYKEHLDFEQVAQANDPFLQHMENKNDEHLYLYSRRSTEHLWDRLGFSQVAFEQPVFAYDLYYVDSRAPLGRRTAAEIDDALLRTPAGRLVLALLDKAYESNDRWWAVQRLEAALEQGTRTKRQEH